jgi:hypothetical protein
MDINWQVLTIAVISVAVIKFFSIKTFQSAQEGELKFSLFIKGLGLVCLLFSAVPLFVFLTGNYQVDKPGETNALIGLTIGFGLGAFYTLAEGFFVKGSYDNTSIMFSTPWTRKKIEKWDDLESIKFNRSCYWYVLKFKSGKIIRLSSYLSGHGSILALLQNRGHGIE